MIKSYLTTLCFVVTTLIAINAQAESKPARISFLTCTALDSHGATSVIFSGNFGGDAYMNVTNVNQFGVPFTQQARIADVTMTSRNSFVFTLRTMLTGADIYLELFNRTSKGVLSMAADDDVNVINLSCSSQIDG